MSGQERDKSSNSMKRPRFFSRPGQLSRSPSPGTPEPARMDDPFKELVSEPETSSERPSRSADGGPTDAPRNMSTPTKDIALERERSPASVASGIAKNVRSSPGMSEVIGGKEGSSTSPALPVSGGSPRGSSPKSASPRNESASPKVSPAAAMSSPVPPPPIGEDVAIRSASASPAPSAGSSLSLSVPSAAQSPAASSITGIQSPSSSVASAAVIGVAVGKSPNSPLPAIPMAPSASPHPSTASSKGEPPVVVSGGRMGSPSTASTGRGSPSTSTKSSSIRGSPAILAQSAAISQSPLAPQPMQEVDSTTASARAGSPSSSTPSSKSKNEVTFVAAKTPSPIRASPMASHTGEGAIDIESQQDLEARKEASRRISTGFKVALGLLIFIIIASIVTFAIFHFK